MSHWQISKMDDSVEKKSSERGGEKKREKANYFHLHRAWWILDVLFYFFFFVSLSFFFFSPFLKIRNHERTIGRYWDARVRTNRRSIWSSVIAGKCSSVKRKRKLPFPVLCAFRACIMWHRLRLTRQKRNREFLLFFFVRSFEFALSRIIDAIVNLLSHISWWIKLRYLADRTA